MNSVENTRTRTRLKERIAVLQQVCAEAYQLAGAVAARGENPALHRERRRPAGKGDERILAIFDRGARRQPGCMAARMQRRHGLVGAPEKALDNLAAAAEGRAIPHATFLPVSAADCEELGDAETARATRHATGTSTVQSRG